MQTRGLPNPVDKHVGSRVRMRRLMLGMSQQKLGSALGLTFQQVQKYEKGMNRMGAGRLQEAADILGVAVPFFFEGAPAAGKLDGSAPSSAYVTEFISSPDGLRLIKAFTQISDADLRRSIIGLVQELADE
jgi:transcriptional regulator with XRE-family HTH domain